MKNRPFFQRLRHALQGGILALRQEKSLRTQSVLIAFGAIWLLGWRAALTQWVAFVLASALMVAAELINSALEALCDHLHPQRHDAIGAVKDMAAAAVLVTTVPFVLTLLWPAVERFLS